MSSHLASNNVRINDIAFNLLTNFDSTLRLTTKCKCPRPCVLLMSVQPSFFSGNGSKILVNIIHSIVYIFNSDSSVCLIVPFIPIMSLVSMNYFSSLNSSTPNVFVSACVRVVSSESCVVVKANLLETRLIIMRPDIDAV